MTSTRTVIALSAVALALVLSVGACIAFIPHASVGLAPILQAIAQIIRAIDENLAEPDNRLARPARRSVRPGRPRPQLRRR